MEKRQDPRIVLEQTYNRHLDKLYTSSVKCPYCKNKIQKLQTVCSQCGLNKIQIAYASNKRAKEMMKTGESGKIVRMRHRPTDVKIWSMVWRLVFGLFGVHNFYTGRKIRGWISLGFMMVFIAAAIILLSIGVETLDDEWVQPVAMLSTPATVIWIADAFAVVFGWYKYPVRLGEIKDVEKVWAR